MGMFSAIARVFGGAKEADAGNPSGETVVVDWKEPDAPKKPDAAPGAKASPGGTGGSRLGTLSPNEPVKIDLSDSPAANPTGANPTGANPTVKVPSAGKPGDGKLRGAPPTELVKAEEVRDALKDELRDSYEMAISLAEKVDKHLDTQEVRSRRLLEIAESLPTALESLGSIGEGQAELRGAVTELAEAFRDGQASTQKGLAMQLESLGRVEGLIAEANDSQKEIRASIESLSSAFTEITESNKRLGDTLTDMKHRDAEREQRLEAANQKTHKLLMGVVIGGVVIGGLAVLALVAQTLVQAGVFAA
ncbi:MAG: hypothetical protein AAFU49_21115 [Pseudomonadota bacterium]